MLTAIVSVLKSSEDQTAHKRLLSNQTVASVSEARQQHEWSKQMSPPNATYHLPHMLFNYMQ